MVPRPAGAVTASSLPRACSAADSDLMKAIQRTRVVVHEAWPSLNAKPSQSRSMPS